MTLLRKKHITLNPVIRIQKMFRGWRMRAKLREVMVRQELHIAKIRKIARHWINFTKNRIRLRELTKKRKIEHLTSDLRQYKLHLIGIRMLELAREAKLRILERSNKHKNEIMIQKLLMKNYASFKLLYKTIKL